MQIQWQNKPSCRRFGWITLSGEPWREVSKRLFFKRLEDFRACSSEGELESCFQKLEAKLAYSEALRSLSLRSRLPCELRQKLEDLALSPAAIDATLEKCRACGYLDERAEVERRVELLGRRGWGPQRIAAKLRLADPDLVREALAGACRGSVEAIRALVEKRYRWKDVRGKHKAIRSLLRRGYSLESILAAIGRVEYNNGEA